jgi:hypothetical protein
MQCSSFIWLFSNSHVIVKVGFLMNLKKNPIHGKKTAHFYDSKWFVELFASGPPAVAGAAAAYKAYEADPSGTVWLFLAGGLIWLVLAQIGKVVLAYRQERKDDEQRSHDGLNAALKVLYAVVIDALGPDDLDLRATFHRVVPPLSDPEKLEQIVPYVGGNGDGENRTFPIYAGITGAAVRKNEILIMDRQSQGEVEYKKELVAEWNYTESGARKMTMDRFSAIAIPVSDKTGKQVLGVIYMDAKRKNCFSSKDVQKLVVAASGGITQYVGERYV